MADFYAGSHRLLFALPLFLAIAVLTSGCVIGNGSMLGLNGSSNSGGSAGSGSSGGSSGPAQAGSTTLGLSWNPSPGNVTGYTIYYGDTPDTVNNVYEDIPLSSGTIDPAAPHINIAAVNDLGLRAGDQVCFSIQAYNANGVSGLSTPACTTVS